MWGIRPRPDWMDAGDFKDEVVLWTHDEHLARSIVKVFYHNMAEVVRADAPTE